MRDFEDKTAVVTGGASGMGLAFAECFAREGMNVVIADVEEKALREAGARIEALGGSVSLVPTDVADSTAMDHLAEATRAAFGAAHVVCLNAGVGGGVGPLQQLSINDWKWCLDVNLWGVIHGLRVFLGGLIEQDEGHVVITSSVAGLTSYPNMGPYNASKHAVAAVAETLFAELAEAGSQVGASCLCPGLVATRIFESERNRPKELTDDVETAAPDPALHEFVSASFAAAKPPAEVAELVLAAIVERRFWIQTDELFREPIRQRHRAIETDGDPPARGSILSSYLA